MCVCECLCVCVCVGVCARARAIMPLITLSDMSLCFINSYYYLIFNAVSRV